MSTELEGEMISKAEHERIVRQKVENLQLDAAHKDVQIFCRQNYSDTATTLAKNQTKNTHLVFPDGLSFLQAVQKFNEDSYLLPSDFVNKVYDGFVALQPHKPLRTAPEVTRNVNGSAHAYFECLFNQFASEARKNPDVLYRIGDQYVDYEKMLPPSRFKPDYHGRHALELFPSLTSAYVTVEIKRESRPSAPGDLIEEAKSDTISYTNARFVHLMDDCRKDAKSALDIFAVGVGITPDKVVAVLVENVVVPPATNMDNPTYRPQMSVTNFMQLHGRSGTPGPGFALLLNILACGPRVLHCAGPPLREFYLDDELAGQTLQLTGRLGTGGSASTYSAILNGAPTAIKISKYGGTTSILTDEVAIIDSVRNRVSVGSECTVLPRVTRHSTTFIAMVPCGTPLTSVIGDVFAYQQPYPNDERKGVKLTLALPGAPATAPSVTVPHPIGLLSLSSVVFRSVAEALDLAHAAGYVHTDLRPNNIILHTNSAGQYISACLIDWGSALPINGATQQPPGSTHFAALEVLALLESQKPWIPVVKHDLEALVWCIWTITCALPGHLPFLGTNTREEALKVQAVENRWVTSIVDMLAFARTDGATAAGKFSAQTVTTHM